MMEQYNIILTIFSVIMVALLAGIRKYVIYNKNKAKKLKKENDELARCLDDLYYLINVHGGFHDSTGSYGSINRPYFEQKPNKEIAKLYERFYAIYNRASNSTSYYYGCRKDK